VATYEYDHEGKRTKKVAGTKTELYYYDGDVLYYITDADNVVRYSFGRDADGKLLTMTDHTAGVKKTYTYVYNYRGDIIGMLDGNGTTVASYTYNAYGQILNQAGTGQTNDGKPLYSENPFKYAGYFYDGETEYYYLMARYYDSVMGRFLNKDLVLSTNLYWYAENNPVNLIDSNGLYAIQAYRAINKWEKGFMFLHPKATYNFYKAEEKASAATKRFYKDTWKSDGNSANAFKHAYWNALMVKANGYDLAYDYATAHEKGQHTELQKVAVAMAMDIYNNEIGRRIAIRNPKASDEELAKLIYAAVKRGEMKVMAVDKKGNYILIRSS
jgi:RHS repeat-associated protein